MKIIWKYASKKRIEVLKNMGGNNEKNALYSIQRRLLAELYFGKKSTLSRCYWYKGLSMKKYIYMICLLFTISQIYADNLLKDIFVFDSCQHIEYSIDEHGWLEHDKLENSNYSECMVISIDGLKNIPFINYYPLGLNSKDKKEGMFEINNQKFVFHDSYFDSEIEIVSIYFDSKQYLLLTGEVGKYGDRVCFIFDITDPKHILFYPPGKGKFVTKELADNCYFGLFQNKLCFFFSTRRFDWNGQYKLSPYFIEGDSLKELCDKNGNPYFVNYSYTTKYEQEFVIEDKNIP